ncbi:hypothetical protein HBA55_37040 [Pseudomaricurvus alkylphenolicus]|uniref:hypothetical protein n=1 Tax=Pseudomaricurvus alkylphenolicus TaxID=1306991 RepID=UPI00141F75CA|nr:hypothetical protein [Pseudomaricurvus alkylphenolicus]NIB45237.1 hypothetical protein [Pseudomaricurvus alkylphenolicus]
MNGIIPCLGAGSSGLGEPLGINTKSSSPQATTEHPESHVSRGLRADRYSLQNVIRKLIIAKSDFDPDNPNFEVYNKLRRVVKCHRVRVKPTVDVMRDVVHLKAFYRNVTSCGSVWDCPVCSVKIMEKRRQEISQGVSWAYSSGFKVVMVSFTTPHYAYQTCSDLLGSFAKALKYLRSGKVWQRIKSDYSLQGVIRALETLYGSNGWHNHTHELWIVDACADAAALKHEVLRRWEAACRKYGLLPRGKVRSFRIHAVDVKDNATTSDYLAKQDDKKYLGWGVDRELTNPLSKASKELLHPFQLASLYGSGDRKAGELFNEYSLAFKGRASVFWSQGLKKRCLCEEESDEQIAESDAEESELVISLEHFAWSRIVELDARSYILDLAETEGFDGVESWLRDRGLNSVVSFLMQKKGGFL